MSIRLRLILSFLLITLLGANLGAIAIWSNQQLINQLTFKEKPVRHAIDAATEISNHSKWAEKHLYLFLTLQNPNDKVKFHDRIKGINQQLDFLEKSNNQADIKNILSTIETQNKLLLTRGNKLFDSINRQIKNKHRFLSTKYEDQIFDVHEITNHMRSQAMQLNNLLTDILNRQIEHTAANNVNQNTDEAESHLMLYLMLDDSLSKELFFSGVDAIGKQIDILKRHSLGFSENQILNKIIQHKQELLAKGNLLIKNYENNKRRSRYFSTEKNQADIHSFHQSATILRNSGVELEKIKTDLEKAPRQNKLQQAQVFNYTVFIIVSCAFLLSIFLGLWLAIGLSSSIKRLQIAAKKVGEGNLDVIVKIDSKDSIGVLATTFNQMTDDLKKAHQKFEKRNQLLNQEIIHRIEIEKELQDLATTDPLTGILNRRAFFDRAKDEMERMRRYHKKLSVLMLDLDHFKLINDNYGHRGGDEVLRVFTKEASNPLRKSDILGRIGGEEFSILLPETDLNKAVNIAERIRLRIESITLPIEQKKINFTVSIGISEVNSSEKNIDSALNRADHALYKAKRAGRNQVCKETLDFHSNNIIKI